MWISSILNTIYWRDYFSPYWVLLVPYQRFVDCIYMDLFLGFPFCSFGPCIQFYTSIILFEYYGFVISSLQLLSHVWLCDPMDCSTLDSPVLHQLPELTQTHVHWVGDAIQPSHPLSSPSPALNLSQHQGLFPFFASGGQSTGISASASVDILPTAL